MSLFDDFKKKDQESTPATYFAAALIYMIAADGRVEPEEINQLQSIFGDRPEYVKMGLEIFKSTEMKQFISISSRVLDKKQKLCTLLNMLEIMLSDGDADPNEQKMFEMFMLGYGFSEFDMHPYIDTLISKNNRSIFF